MEKDESCDGKVWTKKRPTEEGWYWWRRPSCPREPVIVKISNILKYADGLDLQITVVGTPSLIPLDSSHPSCEWLGPLTLDVWPEVTLNDIRLTLLEMGSRHENEDIKEVLFTVAGAILNGSEKELALFIQPFIKESGGY